MNCGKSDRCELFNGKTCEYNLQPRANYLCFEHKTGKRRFTCAKNARKQEENKEALK